ncbi:hypothetical protein FDP41_008887 [Naegleria fowleri]|uniref:RRM domain-containing protein n=1 Tax=Naegleria fowleri TaxID=5763 RepID=A0A6A5BFA3_NAEFO|nr:uncharacterized protein FDP41_008887 [Naegleria fowleri]KAF0972638.1 hypothetical protein FDP41_008887 [Naegleria fowleri]
MKKLSSHYSLIHNQQQQQQCTTTATKQLSSVLGNHHVTSITTTSTTLSNSDTSSSSLSNSFVSSSRNITVTTSTTTNSLHLHQQDDPVIVADRSILLNDPLHLYHQYKKRAHQQQQSLTSSGNGSENGNHTQNVDANSIIKQDVVLTTNSHAKSQQESSRREPNPTTTPSPSSSSPAFTNKKRKKSSDETNVDSTTAASSKSSAHNIKSNSLSSSNDVKPITTSSVLPPLPRIKKSSSSSSSISTTSTSVENDQPSPASLSSSSNPSNNHHSNLHQPQHTIAHHYPPHHQHFHTPHPQDANANPSNKDPSSLLHPNNHHLQSTNSSSIPTTASYQQQQNHQTITANTALLPSNHPDHPSSFNKRIFVGGLKESTTEQELIDFFSLPPNNYGPVIHCVIMKKWDGRSRGFGFVTFSEESIAKRVLSDHKERPFTMGCHRIDCQPAQGNFNSEQSPTATTTVGAFQASVNAVQQFQQQTLQSSSNTGSNTSNVDHDQNSMIDSFPSKKETCSFDKKRRIFVGGLQPQVTKQAVQDYFSKYGTIEDLQLILNRRTPFAFITYSEEEAVNRALDDFYSGVLCKEFPAHDVRRAMPKGSFSFTKQREREMELANSQSPRAGRGPLHRPPTGHRDSASTKQPSSEHFDMDGTLNHGQGNGASSTTRKSHINYRYTPYDVRTASSRRSMPFYVDESMTNANSALSPPTTIDMSANNSYFNGNSRVLVPTNPYVHSNGGTSHHAHVHLMNHMDRPPHAIPPPSASVVPPIYSPPPLHHPHHRPGHVNDDRYGPKGSPSTSIFYSVPFYESHAFPPVGPVMHHPHQIPPPANGVGFVRSNPHKDNISNSSSEDNNRHNQFSSRR